MSNNFVFSTTRNDSLKITAYGIDNIINAPCLILVHGFKGFKDWGFGPFIGKFLSDKGFFVLTFNFSHNGIGDNPIEFTELDKFAKNTFSLEIEELSQLIDAYLNGFFGKTENRKIGLIGHSRGGAISILTAKQKSEIDALAVWSSVSKFDRYSDRQKENWRKKGAFEVMNSRTKQVMRLNISLLDDLEKHKNDLLNIEKGIKELNRPFLIVHGEQDLAVPLKEGEKLYEWSNKELTKFVKIPAAGHTFDVAHPFQGTNSKFDKVLNNTLEFFKENFN
ncbi:MAG: alpha/beta fold hydrolase [Ignavibacteriaceae bacterium]